VSRVHFLNIALLQYLHLWTETSYTYEKC